MKVFTSVVLVVWQGAVVVVGLVVVVCPAWVVVVVANGFEIEHAQPPGGLIGWMSQAVPWGQSAFAEQAPAEGLHGVVPVTQRHSSSCVCGWKTPSQTWPDGHEPLQRGTEPPQDASNVVVVTPGSVDVVVGTVVVVGVGGCRIGRPQVLGAA
jgi:hypothetical protein